MDISRDQRRNDASLFLSRTFRKTATYLPSKKRSIRWEQVHDVFIPNKKDLKGRRFGFARFSSNQDQNALLEEINKVWIGLYKIRAFYPRFDRGGLEAWDMEKARENIHATKVNQVRIDKSSRRKDGTLYSEILTGKRKGGEGNERGDGSATENMDMEYQSSPAERTWLEKCYTGYLKPIFSWREHREEIQSEYGDKLKLRFMGNNMILIQGAGDENDKVNIDEFDEWISFWFVWARPWKYIDISQQRVVWTRWT